MTEAHVRLPDVHPVRRASPVLRGNVRAPAEPAHYVRRARLLELLDDTVSAALTLVVAPAGAGKTVLLVGWAAEAACPTAWLSLDDDDVDARTFWSGMIAAVEPLVPGRALDARLVLEHRGALDDVVRQLLDDLEPDANRAVLVVDDIHLVDDDEQLVRSLALFLQHLPRWLHVVLSGRRAPRLPIDRMRARGSLHEVHFPELRFSHDEACALLAMLSPTLTGAEIDAAAERAAGWAAGLQLSALAARSAHAREAVPAPSVESDLLVDDYVWHEVLATEDPEVVDVMVRTSVVERVNAGLAEVLTDRPDAEELLKRADARGLFVTRIGVDGWLAVHPLVRAALLAELARRPNDALQEQHARAARWFEGAGQIPAGLEHWLLADRPRDALRLLGATHTVLYDTGREATTRRVLAAIPASVASADFSSLLDYAWCHFFIDRRRFAAIVDQAEWWAEHNGVSAVQRARLTLLASMAATMTGAWTRGGALARRALHEFGDRWWSDPLGRFSWNMTAREIALGERWNEGAADVREAVLALGRDADRGIALQGTQALGEALAGRPVDALRVAAGVRRVAVVTNMTILRGELAIAEAVAHRELGDRSTAIAELTSLADAPVETVLYCRVLAFLELTAAHLDTGDLDAARTTFERAQVLVAAESFGPDGAEWLARTGTQLALLGGDLADARAWSERIEDPFWHPICRARVLLAGADQAGARDALDAAVPRCVRHEVVLGLLRAGADPDHAAQVGHAAVAAELACRNGMMQTVATEGSDVFALIERAAWRLPVEWLDRVRRASTDRRQGGGRAANRAEEPLTERERDVLRFLPSRLTIREIAEELYVSTNTLKFHLKVIYRKLGVASRAEAADAARRMANIRSTRPPT